MKSSSLNWLLTFSSNDLLAAATAEWVKCKASEVDIVGGRGTSLSNVLVVQSLETDFLPSTECAGEGWEAPGMWWEVDKWLVPAAMAGCTAAAAACWLNTFDITKEVERSNGLSSKTLSIKRLKRVCRRYWMAGKRKASSGLSGTKKATSSVFGPTSRISSNTGSPVGPFVPITLISSLQTSE